MRAPRPSKHLVVADAERLDGEHLCDLQVRRFGRGARQDERFLRRRGAGRGGAGDAAAGLAAPVVDVDEAFVDFDGFVCEVVEKDLEKVLIGTQNQKEKKENPKMCLTVRALMAGKCMDEIDVVF